MKRAWNAGIVLSLVVSIAFVAPALAATGQQYCQGKQFSRHQTDLWEAFCADPTYRGASCLSYGLLIYEQDNVGILGDVVQDFSESEAWTWAIPGPWNPVSPPQEREGGHIRPPGDPTAHADAEQVGVTYNNAVLLGGIALDTSTVFSRCDVLALENPDFGLYTEAYGRAGVEDFELSMPGLGLAIGAEVLDFELQAIGQPWFTFALSACDVAQLGATPPGLTLSYCPVPNTGAASAVVTVRVNEQWGPFLNFAGQWVYGGAALHVTVSTVATTVEIYVGYVTVAVTGGPPMPIFWIPDPLVGPGPFPCYPAPCQP